MFINLIYYAFDVLSMFLHIYFSHCARSNGGVQRSKKFINGNRYRHPLRPLIAIVKSVDEGMNRKGD